MHLLGTPEKPEAPLLLGTHRDTLDRITTQMMTEDPSFSFQTYMDKTSSDPPTEPSSLDWNCGPLLASISRPLASPVLVCTDSPQPDVRAHPSACRTTLPLTCFVDLPQNGRNFRHAVSWAAQSEGDLWGTEDSQFPWPVVAIHSGACGNERIRTAIALESTHLDARRESVSDPDRPLGSGNSLRRPHGPRATTHAPPPGDLVQVRCGHGLAFSPASADSQPPRRALPAATPGSPDALRPHKAPGTTLDFSRRFECFP